MVVNSKITRLIKQNGYVALDKMIASALSQYPSSYYVKTESIGVDFVTSPEISQLFGEMIGIWCVQKWQSLAHNGPITIAEFGPGRGVLMRDLLKVIELVPEFYNNLNVELCEINPNLINKQKQILSRHINKIKWLHSPYNISTGPILIIANEFFDALPIKQYIKIKYTWYEVTCVIDAINNKIKFGKIEIDEKLQTQLQQDHVNASNGAIFEQSPQSLEIIRFISNHIKKYSGCVLVIDYGYDIMLQNRTRYHYNSTLQAIKDHQYYPVLDNIGEADISAHVDFNALKQSALAQGIRTCDVTSQAKFLIEYGILNRVRELQKSLNETEKQIVTRQMRRLIDPTQMGELFKVLTLL